MKKVFLGAFLILGFCASAAMESIDTDSMKVILSKEIASQWGKEAAIDIEQIHCLAPVRKGASLSAYGSQPLGGLVSFEWTWLENAHTRRVTCGSVVRISMPVAI
ncbi:MAG: hypothetical protein HY537_08850, partial [Deltaproteobacteria bacterium]|nr:hypothetical protein [Deltaproteobacteria bacterium]